MQDLPGGKPTQTQSSDSLRANLYLAAKSSNWKEGKEGGGRWDGEEKAGGCKHYMGAFGQGPQPASVVVVLVLVFVLLLLVLDFMEVFVGGNGHTDDQQHHLAEAELRILVDVEVFHDFVNGGLVFHILQRDTMRVKSHHSQLKTLPSLAGTPTSARSPTAWC